jgi:hypothetical protein
MESYWNNSNVHEYQELLDFLVCNISNEVLQIGLKI